MMLLQTLAAKEDCGTILKW